MSLDRYFKSAGWKHKAGLWSSGDRRYRVTEEAAPGSWDRSVTAFLAKAILSSRVATLPSAEPIAALSVKRASPLTDERLAEFVAHVAPDQSWVLFDAEGRVFPHVKSAPELVIAAPLAAPSLVIAPVKKQHALFTDLNQWMLKVLLAPSLSDTLLTAPRNKPVRNASVLADLAGVSLAAAARCVQSLEEGHQLDTRFGDLRIARPLELLEQWRDRLGDSARREVAVNSARGPFDLHLVGAFNKIVVKGHPPFMLALHSACDALGVGHVTGALPAAWMPSLDVASLEAHGFVAVRGDRQADLVLREPRFPQSLYRAALSPRGRIPVSDVIQCWLDTSHSRTRGEEQADYLWRAVLKPAFKS